MSLAESISLLVLTAGHVACSNILICCFGMYSGRYALSSPLGFLIVLSVSHIDITYFDAFLLNCFFR